jgi:hypothetical protein
MAKAVPQIRIYQEVTTMTEQQSSDKKIRIALGVGGFLFLLLSTPCVLWFINVGYAAPTDTSGLFGAAGLILFVLFVGLSMLYHAFKTPKRPSKENS